MKFHNIRRGFATNSSSTHSMIFMPDAQDKESEHGDFGWNEFVAASPDAKALWLSAHLVNSAKNTCGHDVAMALAHSWLGVDLTDKDDLPYVDHQSVIALPRGSDGKGVNKEFFDDLKEFVLRDGLAILGGNDNDDTPTGPVDYRCALPTDIHPGDIVARKDSRGWWSLFDRTDGTRYHVSFGADNITKVDPDKSDVPELVDVKITDHCPFECSFCYQGSTKKGNHAGNSEMYQVASVLGALGTFEVALGGGEPTLHPEFLQILKNFRYYGVVPNFTTRNIAWLRDPVFSRTVMENIGSWAFSTEEAEQVKKLDALLVDHGWIGRKKPNIQYIVGVGNAYAFEQVLRAALNADMRVLLLGPKDTGRGADKSWNYINWMTVVRKYSEKGLQFGIDTALAQKYSNELKKAEIPEWCYQTKEGKFSMYIDAVEKKIAASSYGKPEDMISYDTGLRESIMENFPKW